MAPKIVTIFGATGRQGGSVLDTVQSTLSAAYTIRAVTRNPTSASAAALSKRGVEVVAGDLDDPTSLDGALKDSFAIFAVTNYWATASKATEVQQGKNIADAALRNKVSLLIWASLPAVSELTGGKLVNVHHFDGKAEVQAYIEQIKAGSTGLRAAYWRPGLYASNMKQMVAKDTKRGDKSDGKLKLLLPWDADRTRVPLLDEGGDTGHFVAGILAAAAERGPDSVDGVVVNGASEWVSPRQLVETLAKGTGQEIGFEEITQEELVTLLPGKWATEMAENMVLVRDWSYFGKGEEAKQAESDRFWLGQGSKSTWERYVKEKGPWEFK